MTNQGDLFKPGFESIGILNLGLEEWVVEARLTSDLEVKLRRRLPACRPTWTMNEFFKYVVSEYPERLPIVVLSLGNTLNKFINKEKTSC